MGKGALGRRNLSRPSQQPFAPPHPKPPKPEPNRTSAAAAQLSDFNAVEIRAKLRTGESSRKRDDDGNS